MSACCFMFLDDKSVVTSYLRVFMTGLNIKCAIIQGALVLASLLSYKKTRVLLVVYGLTILLV